MTPTAQEQLILEAVNSLPPMPQVASKVLKLVDDPNCGDELVQLLSRDGALAAAILKLSNSVVFSGREKIGDLEEAVVRIGLYSVKGLVLANTLHTLMGPKGDIRRLVWENSVGTAIACKAIAVRLERDFVDEAFLLGVLHNLGQIVLLSFEKTEERYHAVMQTVKNKGIDYISAEEREFGFSHPRVGALLASRWNFPGEICDVILRQGEPVENLRRPVDEKRALVRLADLLCHAAAIGSPEGYPVDEATLKKHATKLKFNPVTLEQDLKELKDRIKAQFDQERHLYTTEKS